MTTQEFIQGLRKQLKGFPAEEQEALLEEISSHIESGEDDPDLGSNIEQRRHKLMAELGSAKEMSAGFKAIYRPSKLIDYLLVAIPYLFYPLLNMLYASLMPKYPWADVRLDILIHLPLIAIGLWRRSALVTLFWITIIVTQIAAMLLLGQGYYGVFQTVLWLAIMLGLLVLLGVILRQNRSDPLIVTYALLPLVMCLAGSLLAVIHPTARVSFGAFDRFLLNIYVNAAGSGSGYLPFYGTLITLALFFLATNRDLRWLGLGLYGLVIGLSRHFVNLFDYRGMMIPAVYTLYAILPLVIVFLGWLLNQSGKPQLELAE